MTIIIRDLVVEMLSVASLAPREGNPRTHTKKQVRQIARSIEAFGWTNPILIDGQGGVIAGHGRLAAAKQLGLSTVPTLQLADLTETQVRAYVIADNRLAELAGWDEGLLAIELQGISALDLDFDIELTGFEIGEIDVLIDGLGGAPEPDGADRIPSVDDRRPVVSKHGDLWFLGRHRLFCGDAMDPTAYDRVLGGARAQMVFTDPPYNVPIAGNVSGLGAVRHGEFVMASGEMSEDQFTTFLATVLGHMAARSDDGAIHFVCMDWRHLFDLLTAGRRIYSEFKNLCVWNKTNGGMGSLYRSKHELVAVFKVGSGAHINNVALGVHGRNRTNVWDYPGMNTLGAGRDADLALHPTVKPVAMVRDAILDCSRRGGFVLDPFAGSGTTIVAAETSGRRFAGLELDPRYVDVALRRYHDLTGEEPIHAETGLSFDERDARQVEPQPEEVDHGRG